MKRSIFSLLVCLALLPLLAHAEEDPAALLSNAQSKIRAGNYPQVLRELRAVTTAVEKLHTQKLSTFFPKTVGKFIAQAPEIAEDPGVISVEIPYLAGEKEIRLVVVGGSGDMTNPMADSFSQISQSLKEIPGSEVLKIKTKEAVLHKEGEGAEATFHLSIFLTDTVMVQVEPNSEGITREDLTKLADSIDIQSLSNYLSGR